MPPSAFDGNDDFITMKPSAQMPDVGDFTVALWTCVQPRKPQVNGSGAWVDRQYILDAHSDAESGQYQTGFFLIYDFTYLDGKLLESTYSREVRRNDPLDLNHTWSIGTFAGNNQPGGGPRVNYSFQGLLDEVMVFNRALAEDEVEQLFELQK
ncbi:MAG: hypothetical protein WCR06_06375 [bacterium]